MNRSLRFIAVAVLLAAASVPSIAAIYTIDKDHSSVGFRVSHVRGRVTGVFMDFSGEIEYDAKKPENSKVSVAVKTDSVNTYNSKRDEHLKGPDFLDTKAYPEMTFKSTKIMKRGKDKYALTGDLMLHGVTKSITLKVEFNGVDKDPWGGTRSGFSATGAINRKEFGMIWNKILDSKAALVGDIVEINLEIEGLEKK